MLTSKRIFLLACLAVTIILSWQVVFASRVSPTQFLPVVTSLQRPSAIQAIPIADDFSGNTISDIAHAGDGRLFILQRDGIVRVMMPNKTLLPTPFIDISERITDPRDNWEAGALGIVFHPEFPAQPYVYISYTSRVHHRIQIERFQLLPGEPNVADPQSGLLILQVIKTGEDDPNVLASPVHNGGDLVFGPDGYLYIGTGDGGPDPHFGSTDPHDPANHGQRTDVLLGKILRIDVDPNGGLPPTCDSRKTTADGNYSVPPDNPFVGTSHCSEIWARGLRNPWRFSFDSLTGDLYISDVGEWLREEINVERAGFAGGANYGWRCFEGTYDQTIDHPIYADRCQNIENNTFPVHEYSHADTFGCSVTGGFVYRGQQYPVLDGYYVYSDFCAGQIWVLREIRGRWESLEVGKLPFISTFGEDVNGELYVGTWSSNGDPPVLYRLEAR